MLCKVIVIIMWYVVQTVHVMKYSKPILLPPTCTFSTLFQLFIMTVALKGRWKQRKQISDHFFLYTQLQLFYVWQNLGLGLALLKFWHPMAKKTFWGEVPFDLLVIWRILIRQGLQLLFLLLVLTVISWTRPFLFSLRKVVDFVIEEHFLDLSKKTDKYLVREQ